MPAPNVPSSARESLRLLAMPHALAFGTRLLRGSASGTISFDEFLAVAREFVTEHPTRSAIYLAALVALDMGDSEIEPPPIHRPSAN